MLKCEFENGSLNSMRHVTTVGLMVNDGKVLLIKRAAHLLGGGKFAPPGGFLDRGETTAEGVCREVLEETGYESTVEHLFAINDNPDRPKEDRQNIDFIFVMNVGKKVGEPDKETDGVHWFPLDELPTEEDFAFDHLRSIELYKQYLQMPFPLPVILSAK